MSRTTFVDLGAQTASVTLEQKNFAQTTLKKTTFVLVLKPILKMHYQKRLGISQTFREQDRFAFLISAVNQVTLQRV